MTVDVQGYHVGSYDVTVTVNSLSTAKDTASAVQNCKALLRVKGLLVATEVTETNALRQLTVNQGFQHVSLSGSETETSSELPQQCIVAGLSDGVVRVFEDEDSLQERQIPAPKQAVTAGFVQSMGLLPLRCSIHAPQSSKQFPRTNLNSLRTGPPRL